MIILIVIELYRVCFMILVDPDSKMKLDTLLLRPRLEILRRIACSLLTKHVFVKNL